MKFNPYPYQVDAVNAIQHGLIAQDNFLLTAPCSAGKTFIFCLVIDWLVRNNRKCLVLLDRKELIAQTADRIREYLGNPYPDPVGIMLPAFSPSKMLYYDHFVDVSKMVIGS